MSIGLKVDSNVKLDSLLMQVLDACGCDSYLDAQIVAHEGCGCPIGICCLHYAHLPTQVLVNLKHLYNVETCFYCPQTSLNLDFQCRDDVSEQK
jgi:hypothetical protein